MRLARGDAERLRHGGQRQRGCVVVAAEVAEEDVFEFRCAYLGEVAGSLFVVKMTVWRCYASFQVRGVWTFAQHSFVVVAFDDNEVCLPHVVVNPFGDATEVGCDSEFEVAGRDEESGVVCAVVADFKGCYFKGSDAEGEFFVYWLVVVFIYLVLRRL